MSSINGRLTICDRCGETIFSKCTGEGDTDGGYTRWNEFEPLPEGWEFHHKIGTMCPKCSDQYKILLDDFMKKVDSFMKKETSVGVWNRRET